VLAKKKFRINRSFTHLVLIMSLGAVVAFLIVNGSSANTGNTAVTEERFTNYRQPGGPELSPQEAASRAIQRVLALERPSSPLAKILASGKVIVDVAHSNLATVRAIENGRASTEAITTGSDAEQTELLRSAVYLVKLVGEFSPNVPIPHTATPPRSTVIWLTLDVHTGFMLGLQLGGAPDIAALGPVASFTFGADRTTVTTAEPLDQRRGLLIGTLYRADRPAKGWRIIAVSRGTRVASESSSTGGFVFHLLPGKYRLRAVSPVGTRCVSRTVSIRRRRNSYVALRCAV
jgi:hypothetical protein